MEDARPGDGCQGKLIFYAELTRLKQEPNREGGRSKEREEDCKEYFLAGGRSQKFWSRTNFSFIEDEEDEDEKVKSGEGRMRKTRTRTKTTREWKEKEQEEEDDK